MPCKVMLDSFFASNPNEKGVTVYLLHSAIPDEKLEELAGFSSRVSSKFIVTSSLRNGIQHALFLGFQVFNMPPEQRKILLPLFLVKA